MNESNKNKLDKVSRKHIQAMLVFLTVFLISQIAFSNMWTGGLSKIDLFEIVIAPSCCFALAASFGWYKNVMTTVLSSVWIFVFANIFYAFFQKVSFFREGTYESLLKMNWNVMGTIFIGSTILSILIIAFVRFFSDKK